MFTGTYEVLKIDPAPHTYGRQNVELHPVQYDESGNRMVGVPVVIQTADPNVLAAFKVGETVTLAVGR
jgi:hypothetical protein